MQFTYTMFNELVHYFMIFLDFITTIMQSSVTQVKDFIFNGDPLLSFNYLNVYATSHAYFGFDLGLFGNILELITSLLNMPLFVFSLVFKTNLLNMPFLYYVLIYIPLLIFTVGLVITLVNFVLKLIRSMIV